MKKVSVGLALGGGGARAFAHVGVIRALEENNYTISSLAGISGGAIVAAGYAQERDLAKLTQHILEFPYKRLMKKYYTKLLLDTDKLVEYFDTYLGNAAFEDLQIPLTVLTTDFKKMTGYPIHSGSVSKAILISSMSPFIHKPIRYHGRLLVDGGLVSHVPLPYVIEESADLIIGVDVTPTPQMDETELYLSDVQKTALSRFPLSALIWRKKLLKYLSVSQHIMYNQLLEQSQVHMKKKVIIIRPSISHIPMTEFSHTEELIEKGYKSTLLALKKHQQHEERNQYQSVPRKLSSRL